MLTIYIDADGCPVKDEVYRVATRYGLVVRLVANHYVATPDQPRVESIVVGDAFDAADDWIVDNVGEGDIVVTGDIPLAARCLERGAQVLGHKGKPFTEESIGSALAARNLGEQLREMGVMTKGPAPMTKRDRSRFLSRLDEIVNALRRRAG